MEKSIVDKLNDYMLECDPPKRSDCALSIIIPCRSENWSILAMTLQSIQEEARTLGDSWECIVVFNGIYKDKLSDGHEKFKTSNFRRFGNFRYALNSKAGAWQARNTGLANAVGRYIWIGDSHLILGRDLFTGMINTFQKIAQRHPIGLLHSSLGWLSGVHHKDLREEYRPQLKSKFWGAWTKNHDPLPHKICMSGTSFLMERETVIDMHGWGCDFRPYGGGEPYINLKMWVLGKEVWTTPNYYVWHLAQNRNYCWCNDDLWVNFMLAAYTIGGSKWLDNQYNNYANYLKERHTGEVLRKYLQTLDSLRSEAFSLGAADRSWIESHTVHDLDSLIIKYGWE